MQETLLSENTILSDLLTLNRATADNLTDGRARSIVPSSSSLTSLALEITPERYSPERKLKEDIEKLKDPEPYRAAYESPEVQQLVQAIDLLDRLKQSAFLTSADAGYQALVDAKIYLDRRLKEHFRDEQ